MNREELLARSKRREARDHVMRVTERAVIEALPDLTNYLRVVPSDDLDRPDNAGVELSCENYTDALSLAELALPMMALSVVKLVREGQETTSFFPTEQTARFEDDKRVKALVPIVPIVFHAQPIGQRNRWRPKVYVEWYTPMNGRAVNVRAIIEKHTVKYDRLQVPGARWTVEGLPRGEERRSFVSGPYVAPPFVAVYWWRGTFNEEWGLTQVLQEVAL
jgi:hypothetical protein